MKKFNLFYVIISIAILIITVLGWIFFGSYLEIEKPAIKFTQEFYSYWQTKNHRNQFF